MGRSPGGTRNLKVKCRIKRFGSSDRELLEKSDPPKRRIKANDLRLKRDQCHWKRLEKSRQFYFGFIIIRGHMKKLGVTENRTRKIIEDQRGHVASPQADTQAGSDCPPSDMSAFIGRPSVQFAQLKTKRALGTPLKPPLKTRMQIWTNKKNTGQDCHFVPESGSRQLLSKKTCADYNARIFVTRKSWFPFSFDLVDPTQDSLGAEMPILPRILHHQFFIQRLGKTPTG